LADFLHILFVILFSSIKFVLVPPIAILEYHFSFWESLIYTSIGGAIGVLVFYVLSKEIFALWLFIKTLFRKKHHHQRHHHYHHHHHHIRISKSARRMVLLKKRWGFYGLIILTPCLLSIPIGTFIAAKYYPSKRTILFLCMSVVMWSILLNLFFYTIGILM